MQLDKHEAQVALSTEKNDSLSDTHITGKLHSGQICQTDIGLMKKI